MCVCARREKPDMRTLLEQIILNALASYNKRHEVEVQIYWSQGHYISSPSDCSQSGIYTLDRKILAYFFFFFLRKTECSRV